MVQATKFTGKPNAEQAARIEALYSNATAIQANASPSLSFAIHHHFVDKRNLPSLAKDCEGIFALLEQQYKPDWLAMALADVFCFSLAYERRHSTDVTAWHTHRTTQHFAATSFLLRPNSYARKLLVDAFRFHLGQPDFWYPAPAHYLLWQIGELLALVADDSPEYALLFDQFARGELVPPRPTQGPVSCHLGMEAFLVTCWEFLHQRRRFTEEVFRIGYRWFPHVLSNELVKSPSAVNGNPGEFTTTAARNFLQLAYERACDLNENNSKEFLECRVIGGTRFLLKACELSEKYQPKKLHDSPYYGDGVDVALARMANLECIENDLDRPQVIAELRKFQPVTLLKLLPFSGLGSEFILEALNQSKMQYVMELLVNLGKAANVFRDQSNAPVVKPKEVIAIVRKAGIDDTKTFIESFAKVDNWKSGATLLAACLDWNESELEKSLNRHSQLAAQAYGLLPLTGTPTQRTKQCLERFLRLKQFAKECQQFGADRQANSEAAAEVGLCHLAVQAGYTNATRLEWAMEAELSAESTLETERQIDDYRLLLVPTGREMTIEVEKKGKQLKTIPAAVRKTAVYKEFKETVANLKSQQTRFREGLERLLCDGEWLSLIDVQTICAIPVGREMINRLIFETENGECGLFDFSKNALVGIKNASIKINGSLRIAHSYQLYQQGNLSDWQNEIVQRQIEQPFKQAFRELYLLTPAEIETATYSNRFAGHEVTARVAAKLLQTRGWRSEGSEPVVAYKTFPNMPFRACISFPDSGHFLSELPVITTDRVYFESNQHDVAMDRLPTPLQEIPPLIFSEVMRDVDLFVSVAQTSDEVHYSSEMCQSRGELVLRFVECIHLPGVKIENRFAHISGKLANYRVHLGSGVIHIEPGNYLCIVPAGSFPTAKIYLPFADEDDPKSAEIISKIILLTNDDKIKDMSILQQIRRAKDV